MKNKKMVLWIALVVMAIIPVYAQQYDSEKDFQIDWDKNVEGGVIITQYIGAKKEVRIPPSIQNNPVTGIGNNAFEYNGNITRVIIPNSVTSIGDGAFSGCDKLTSVIIPDSVTYLSGFNLCTSLKSITIPNSVTSIGSAAFYTCRSLTSVTIGNSVTSIGRVAFYNCRSLTSVTIPNSVTSIDEQAFDGCTKLTNVIFQSTIPSKDFYYNAFPGDLCTKYLASDGGPGTYKRFANGDVWKKQ